MPYQHRQWRMLACVTLVIMPLFVAACSPTPSRPDAAVSTPSAAPSPLARMTPAPPTLRPTRVTATPGATPGATPSAAPSAMPNPTLVAGLAGLWKGDNGSFYLLNQDGTWNWDQQRGRVAQAPENRGKWWIEGDVFNIVDLSGKQPCPRSQIGHYQMEFAGAALVLRRVADLCGERVPQTAGTYSRLSDSP